MHKIRTTLLLCIVFLFSSPVGIGLAQNVDPARSEEGRVPSEKSEPFREDYERLWTELNNCYPYLSYLREKKLDVDTIYERYAAELEAIKEVEAFSGLIRRMFGELNNFAHLDLVTPEIFQTYYYVYILNDGIVPAEFSTPFVEILQDERLASRYQAAENLDDYQRQGSSGRYPEVSVHYYFDCKALYLQIPSFAQELVLRDSAIVCDALKQYPEAEHIIFDITGNSGGSDYYWMENLVAPFGGHYEFAYRNYLRSSALTDEYYAALETLPTADLCDAPKWVNDMGLDRYFVTRIALPDEESECARLRGTVNRWVLTSGTVFSAAEKFACFCKTTGWATVVGTRTAGDGLGSTPVLILLPDSGLLIRFSAMVGENPDGSINAVSGTYPDVLCTKGALPLSRCLELIREGYNTNSPVSS